MSSGTTPAIVNIKTQCSDFFDVFASRPDVFYDRLHSCALVLTSLVVHSLYIWVQKNATNRLPLLIAHCTVYLNRHPYRPAKSTNIHGEDWAMSIQRRKI